MYIGPHRLLANTQRGSPSPPPRERKRESAAQLGCRASTGLFENLFSKKCAFKNNLQLLEKKFLTQTNTTPKNGILLSKMAHFQESSIFQ